MSGLPNLAVARPQVLRLADPGRTSQAITPDSLPGVSGRPDEPAVPRPASSDMQRTSYSRYSNLHAIYRRIEEVSADFPAGITEASVMAASRHLATCCPTVLVTMPTVAKPVLDASGSLLRKESLHNSSSWHWIRLPGLGSLRAHEDLISCVSDNREVIRYAAFPYSPQATDVPLPRHLPVTRR
jgi:hypothetical protein